MTTSNKICYIAGPITGYEHFNHSAFNFADVHLKADGYQTFNPASLPHGLTEHQYMSLCLPMISASTHIYMLPGWKKSKGATAEHALALKLGLTIIYEWEK